MKGDKTMTTDEFVKCIAGLIITYKDIDSGNADFWKISNGIKLANEVVDYLMKERDML